MMMVCYLFSTEIIFFCIRNLVQFPAALNNQKAESPRCKIHFVNLHMVKIAQMTFFDVFRRLGNLNHRRKNYKMQMQTC
jgi:hypothetical protein